MEPMTPEVKENDEFAKWLEQWFAGIQQSRVLSEQIPPEKRASAGRQRHSATKTQELRTTSKVLPEKSIPHC
jgi:hypothetical protein